MAEHLRERAPRYHRRVLALGAIAALAAFVIGAPIYNDRIESDLEQRVPAALGASGFSDVTATFDGQDGTLSCDAPLDDPERAVDVAYDVWGVRKIDVDRGCRVRTAADGTVPGESDTSSSGGDGSGTGEGTGDDDPATADDEPLDPNDADDFATVADIVEGSPELSLFADLAQGTSIVERLAGADAVTLFAPSDAAFDALPADALAEFRDDPERLDDLLSHHVVDGRLFLVDLSSGPLSTASGDVLDIEVTDATIGVDSAIVTQPDVAAGNGVVHVVDQVLVPTGVEVTESPTPAGVRVVLGEDGTIILTGAVATEVERAALVGAATADVETAEAAVAIDDQLTVDPDTGLDAGTTADLVALVEILRAQLLSGAVGFDGIDLFVTGRYATPDQRDAVESVAESKAATVELELRPEATETDAERLETDLNEFAAANPILFEPGSAVPDESAADIISSIARRLVQLDGVGVTVEGHTDSDGTPASNLALSQARAAAVVSELVRSGVDPATVTSEGFGDERPVLVDGVEDRLASRRVEFRVEART